eukprot:TRINITY_DN12620_c0_g1_i1.p1 TRINITY_DN12620_c0_g1~~TRINITY_DN12620_c0_g1_i1.p1  ORF type:complete len:1117 (+),score=224.85 TRINITY_DN12620_c0_g1_i1:59-3409(+)
MASDSFFSSDDDLGSQAARLRRIRKESERYGTDPGGARLPPRRGAGGRYMHGSSDDRQGFSSETAPGMSSSRYLAPTYSANTSGTSATPSPRMSSGRGSVRGSPSAAVSLQEAVRLPVTARPAGETARLSGGAESGMKPASHWVDLLMREGTDVGGVVKDILSERPDANRGLSPRRKGCRSTAVRREPGDDVFPPPVTTSRHLRPPAAVLPVASPRRSPQRTVQRTPSPRPSELAKLERIVGEIGHMNDLDAGTRQEFAQGLLRDYVTQTAKKFTTTAPPSPADAAPVRAPSVPSEVGQGQVSATVIARGAQRPREPRQMSTGGADARWHQAERQLTAPQPAGLGVRGPSPSGGGSSGVQSAAPPPRRRSTAGTARLRQSPSPPLCGSPAQGRVWDQSAITAELERERSVDMARALHVDPSRPFGRPETDSPLVFEKPCGSAPSSRPPSPPRHSTARQPRGRDRGSGSAPTAQASQLKRAPAGPGGRAPTPPLLPADPPQWSRPLDPPPPLPAPGPVGVESPAPARADSGPEQRPQLLDASPVAARPTSPSPVETAQPQPHRSRPSSTTLLAPPSHHFPSGGIVSPTPAAPPLAAELPAAPPPPSVYSPGLAPPVAAAAAPSPAPTSARMPRSEWMAGSPAHRTGPRPWWQDDGPAGGRLDEGPHTPLRIQSSQALQPTSAASAGASSPQFVISVRIEGVPGPSVVCMRSPEILPGSTAGDVRAEVLRRVPMLGASSRLQLWWNALDRELRDSEVLAEAGVRTGDVISARPVHAVVAPPPVAPPAATPSVPSTPMPAALPPSAVPPPPQAPAAPTSAAQRLFGELLRVVRPSVGGHDVAVADCVRIVAADDSLRALYEADVWAKLNTWLECEGGRVQRLQHSELLLELMGHAGYLLQSGGEHLLTGAAAAEQPQWHRATSGVRVFVHTNPKNHPWTRGREGLVSSEVAHTGGASPVPYAMVKFEHDPHDSPQGVPDRALPQYDRRECPVRLSSLRALLAPPPAAAADEAHAGPPAEAPQAPRHRSMLPAPDASRARSASWGQRPPTAQRAGRPRTTLRAGALAVMLAGRSPARSPRDAPRSRSGLPPVASPRPMSQPASRPPSQQGSPVAQDSRRR